MVVARTDRLPQSIETEVREGVGAEKLTDLGAAMCGGDQLIAVRRIDPVIARGHGRRAADPHVDLTRASGLDHRDDLLTCCTPDDRIVDQYDPLTVNDAAHRMLAEACRVGTSRPAHRVSAEQRQVRRQLRVRDLLVRARGRTISLMRALVRSEGLRVRAGDADRFGTYVQELTLPAELATALRPLLAVWEQLTAHLAVADAAIVETAATNPVVQRLTTAPGGGPLIATAFVATLDEAGRFGGAHQVESYLGLVPSEYSSADRHRRGHITKAGNPRMRWLLVQAAWAARFADHSCPGSPGWGVST